MDSEEDKGLVSYGEFYFQMYEHDEIVEELKGIDLVKKHLENE
jgi:hypothetical protein